MAAKIRVPASTFLTALENLAAPTQQRQGFREMVPEDHSPVSLELKPENRPILEELSKLKLAKTNRAKLSTFLHGVKIQNLPALEVLDQPMLDFTVCVDAIQRLKGKDFEIQIQGRWYLFTFPTVVQMQDRKKVIGFGIRIVFQMVRETHEVGFTIYRQGFGQVYAEKTLREILDDHLIRPYQKPENPEHLPNVLVGRALSASEHYGDQVLVSGAVFESKVDMTYSYYGGDRSWVTHKQVFEPEKCVVEPELELPGERQDSRFTYTGRDEDPHGTLPFVRVFSLRTRTYLYTDIRNLTPYQYQEGIDKQIVLDSLHRSMLQKIFEVGGDTIKDLIPGKTGGICVLAYGNSGTGKTLTAEVYAEIKQRPLYALSVSEIGVNPTEIENNLQRVFTRVERWNAVLLFDECDIFLSRRGDDLNQAAVVGMFLRLLDYYNGTLFLTTNRSPVIDHAVDSRIAFRFHYPDLNADKRKVIWQTLLLQAKIQFSEDALEFLAQQELDGRKIRNAVRVLQINKVTQVTPQQYRDIEQFLVYSHH